MTAVLVDRVVQGGSLVPRWPASPSPLSPVRDTPWYRPLRRRTWRRIDARSQARRRAHRQERAWQLQDVLANVRGPELVQYGIPFSCAGGRSRSVYVPPVIGVDDGPPEVFTVQLLPGQLPADFEQHAAALAFHLGVARVRVSAVPRTPGSPPLVRLALLEHDPLEDTVHRPLDALDTPYGRLLLGVDDVANRYRISPFDLGHTVIQGQTGSGKSALAYWLLAHLAGVPDLVVAGSDVSGLLLRPFAGTAHEEWQVRGSDNPDAHLWLLRRLVNEMDDRITAIPDRTDSIAPTGDTPLIVVVLEEYAGLIRLCDDSTANRRSARVAEIQRLVGRLLAEGRKAAIRVVLILQRAETTVLGGFERAQCSLRITFRVDNADSIVMLHPTGRAEAEQHTTCPPGLALFSGPGVPLARIRVPYLGDPLYATYCDHVTSRAARLPH